MNIIINPADNNPIYYQIYKQIKNSILTDELKSGYPLPSIRTLANDLKISVITTKRAYEDLENDGFINMINGKGCFVASLDSNGIIEASIEEIDKEFGKIVILAKSTNISLEKLINLIKRNYEET